MSTRFLQRNSFDVRYLSSTSKPWIRVNIWITFDVKKKDTEDLDQFWYILFYYAILNIGYTYSILLKIIKYVVYSTIADIQQDLSFNSLHNYSF